MSHIFGIFRTKANNTKQRYEVPYRLSNEQGNNMQFRLLKLPDTLPR